MRFSEPNTFLLQAILLGLYKPSEPAALVGPAVLRTGCSFSDNSTCVPHGGILRRPAKAESWPADRRRFVMQIYGSTQLHGAQGINAPHFNRTQAPAKPNTQS